MLETIKVYFSIFSLGFYLGLLWDETDTELQISYFPIAK